MLRIHLLTLAVLALLLQGLAARAQEEPPAPSAVVESFGEVGMRLDAIGVGGVVRPGEWTGVRLTLTDSAARPRQVRVRIVLPDPDGDSLAVERDTTLNPGARQPVWLYFRAPVGTTSTSIFEATVHALDEDQALADSEAAPIGSLRFQPTRVADAADMLIGVFGPAPGAGLSAYALRLDSTGLPPTAHEAVEVSMDLRPQDVPDRWVGLQQWGTLIWIEGDATSLTDIQARALREWVIRGGHLVVSTPAVGQTWTVPAVNPLASIMPVVTLERVERAPWNTLKPLLCPYDEAPLAGQGEFHLTIPTRSEEETVEPGQATIVLAHPDGRPLVARRAIGAGAVTLVGLDLSHPAIATRIDPQAFWHRVLGLRFDVLTRDDLRANAQRMNFRLREARDLDVGVAAAIAKSGSAGIGVILGLTVFVAYLLLAGPLGFAALRARKLERHAWLVFVLTVGVFTAIAWGGAGLIRPRRIDVQHLTFLDHVYGQRTERARVWFSALLPDYGEATVRIGDPDEPGLLTDALAPWEDPAAAFGQRFPDSRTYEQPLRLLPELTVPTRSTTKQFVGDWAGGPRWTMPTPVAGPPRLEVLEDGSERLAGALRHDLPAPLLEVTIIVVRRQRPLGAPSPPGGPVPATTSAWRLTDPWAPGATLDLSSLSGAAPGEDYLQRLTALFATYSSAPAPIDLVDVSRLGARWEALSLFEMLEQPSYYQDSATIKPLLRRRMAHGLGLGRWFTQPSVLIIGRVEGAPSPVPIFVDGREAPGSGVTVVRWVYPLASDPPRPMRR